MTRRDLTRRSPPSTSREDSWALPVADTAKFVGMSLLSLLLLVVVGAVASAGSSLASPGDLLVAFLFPTVYVGCLFLGGWEATHQVTTSSRRRRRLPPGHRAGRSLPAWRAGSPLVSASLLPTSTKVTRQTGDLQLVTLDTGWVPGRPGVYAWTAGLRGNPEERLPTPSLRVCLLRRDGSHWMRGRGDREFHASSEDVDEEEARSMARQARQELDPDDVASLTWVTATAPIQELPAGPAGRPLRARAHLEVTAPGGRSLVVKAPFMYVPRVSPEDRIEFQEAEAEEVVCQVCGEEVGARTSRTCERCDTPHHDDCWTFNQGCSTFGCHPGRGSR